MSDQLRYLITVDGAAGSVLKVEQLTTSGALLEISLDGVGESVTRVVGPWLAEKGQEPRPEPPGPGEPEPIPKPPIPIPPIAARKDGEPKGDKPDVPVPPGPPVPPRKDPGDKPEGPKPPRAIPIPPGPPSRR